MLLCFVWWCINKAKRKWNKIKFLWSAGFLYSALNIGTYIKMSNYLKIPPLTFFLLGSKNKSLEALKVDAKELIDSLPQKEESVGGAAFCCQWNEEHLRENNKARGISPELWKNIQLAPFNRLPVELRQMILNSWNRRDKAQQLRIWKHPAEEATTYNYRVVHNIMNAVALMIRSSMNW